MDIIEDIRRILGLEGNPAAASAKGSIAGAQQVEKELQDLVGTGTPKGEPLSASLTQKYLNTRPQSYKYQTAETYRKSTRDVRSLYVRLNNRERIAWNDINGIVHTFLTLLKTDRDILINLAYMPSSAQDYLYTHAINASLLSMALASSAGYSEEQTREIAFSALLGDIGMMRIPETIRMKSGSLSDKEKMEVRRHPSVGVEMLRAISGLPPASILAVYQHHERISGAGYPRQSSGQLIHEYSRIVSIADIYAAMVANRNYRERAIPYQAMESLVKMGATGLLDTRFIRNFLHTLSLFPLGSLVKLDSGRIGKIIHSNDSDFSKPMISILRDGRGKSAPPGTLVDMAKAGQEKIVAALDVNALILDPMDGF